MIRRFLLFPTLGVNLGTRTGKEETRACCGVCGGRPEIAATEGTERFPGNLRTTFFATGDSQLSQRKPRAQLVRQCHVSMAARGRPRRGARTPFGDGWAPRRFRRNRTTKAPRRTAEDHLPGRVPEPLPPRTPPPSRPGASLFPAFGAQGPPWTSTPRPPVGACTRAGAAREPGLDTEAGGGVLSPRATRARPTAASAHDACAGLLAPSETWAFRVRTGCKVIICAYGDQALGWPPGPDPGRKGKKRQILAGRDLRLTLSTPRAGSGVQWMPDRLGLASQLCSSLVTLDRSTHCS